MAPVDLANSVHDQSGQKSINSKFIIFLHLQEFGILVPALLFQQADDGGAKKGSSGKPAVQSTGTSHKNSKKRSLKMATPPKTINVLIVVDTEATQNGHTTVYMVDDNGDASQGSPELTINAKVGDRIKWRVAGIIPDTNPILDQFVRTGGNDVLGGVAFINGVWQATVLSDGQETYHWVFSINGRGHYQWDPFIHVA